MITFNQKIKINKRPACRQAGMTYVELIVVLSIFAVLSSVVVFNYGAFQDRVDIKNLASDIALQIVQAQKSALNGVLPPSGIYFCDICKPSYGVYFKNSTDFDPSNPIPDTSFNKEFVYFADLDNANGYGAGETSNVITITKGNSISSIDKCSSDSCDPGSSSPVISFSVIFKRPDSGATFVGVTVSGAEYIKITIKSPKEATSNIKLYPSGRVQIN